MTEISNNSGITREAAEGEARLPPRVSSRLSVMKDSACARLDNFTGLLSKLVGTEKLLESCQQLHDCVSCCDVSRAALVRIPAALSKLQDEAVKIDLPGVSKHVLSTETNAIATGILTEMANAALAQSNIGARAGTVMLGQGAYNWALTDYDKVVMISKGRDSAAFDAYRLRRFCAELLNEAGLSQPKVGTIARLPVLHAITDLGKGEPLHELIWQAGRPEYPQQTASEALLALGAFLRRVSEVPMDGYGRIRRNPDGPGFRTETDDYALTVSWLTRPHLSPTGDDLAAREKIESLGIFTGPELRELPQLAARLLANVEPPILGHSDPHSGNFLYDRGTGAITALDWDSARATTATAQLARVYGAWVQYAPPHMPTPKRDFATILEGFEPDPARRAVVIERVRETAMLQLYERAQFAVSDSAPTALDTISNLRRQVSLLRDDPMQARA